MNNVIITDVGPRDGLQNQAQILSPQQRLQLIEALRNAGVRSIEVGAFVSPRAVPAMAGAADIVAALPPSDAMTYQALIPNLRGYEMARDAGVRQVLLVIAATQTMNQKNVKLSVEESLRIAEQVIEQSASDGVKVIACLAVAWECPFEGKTDPDTVLALAERLQNAGAAGLLIADTIGAAAPGDVDSLMSRLVERCGADALGVHFHDTRAMGVANAYAALQVGIRRFDASVGGLGGCPFAPGATGNVATEDLVMMLHQMGYTTGIDLPALMRAGELAGTLTGVPTGGRAADWRRLQLEKGRALP